MDETEKENNNEPELDRPPAEPFDVSDDSEPDLIVENTTDPIGIPKSTSAVFGILVIVVVLVIITAITMPRILNARREAREGETIAGLRTIGSSQLAYQGANNEKFYGTFAAMKAGSYIPEDAALGDMIEKYSLAWGVSHSMTGSTSTAHENSNRFTVIAYPRDLGLDNLSTFGITEDMVVRIYNPANENDPNNIMTWDPIL